jgi:hypothetical protein
MIALDMTAMATSHRREKSRASVEADMRVAFHTNQPMATSSLRPAGADAAAPSRTCGI